MQGTNAKFGLADAVFILLAAAVFAGAAWLFGFESAGWQAAISGLVTGLVLNWFVPDIKKKGLYGVVFRAMGLIDDEPNPQEKGPEN